MSTRVITKVKRKASQSASPARSLAPQRRLVVPHLVEEASAAPEQLSSDPRSEPRIRYNFDQISIDSSTQSTRPGVTPAQLTSESCPLELSSPRACPFGGACDSCPPRVQGVMPGIESPIQALVASGGKPLDLTTRSFMEPRFGRDFADVRVHTSSLAAAAADALDAFAFTLGRHIFFGAHKYAPDTSDGRRLLGHELTHVAQQERPMTGRYPSCRKEPFSAACDFRRIPEISTLAPSPSGAPQAKLTLGQPGDKYEKEADRVANTVMRMPEPALHLQDGPKRECKQSPKDDSPASRSSAVSLALQPCSWNRVQRTGTKIIGVKEEEKSGKLNLNDIVCDKFLILFKKGDVKVALDKDGTDKEITVGTAGGYLQLETPEGLKLGLRKGIYSCKDLSRLARPLTPLERLRRLIKSKKDIDQERMKRQPPAGITKG